MDYYEMMIGQAESNFEEQFEEEEEAKSFVLGFVGNEDANFSDSY